MINLYYLFPVGTKPLLRLTFFLLSSGIITILCHAGSFYPTIGMAREAGFAHHDVSYKGLPRELSAVKYPALANYLDKGPKPKVQNDFASTPEETPVTINVLSNDTRGGNDDDDGDDNDDAYDIDSATVDLDPDERGLQQTLSTTQGLYSVDASGNLTFAPGKDFVGNAIIRYTVESKSEETSDDATVNITVSNVNDAPVIIGVKAGQLSTPAGKGLALRPEDFVVSDPDNGEEDFSVNVLPGSNYSVSENTVTPDQAFSGNLPVKVVIKDRDASSEPFNFDLLVTKSNTRPVITGQESVTIPEDGSVAITLDDLIIKDPDEDEEFTLIISGTEAEHYTVSGTTVTPEADYHGTISVPVSVSDGESESEVFDFQITVSEVNDAPVVTAQRALSTNEDTPLTITVTDVTVTDADGQTSFTLRVLEGANYSLSGNTITPNASVTADLSVPVVVSDGTTESAAFNLVVSINQVNDPPKITGQATLTTMENQGIPLGVSDLTIEDPDNATFTLFVQGGANYSVTSANEIIPNPGYNGPLSVPVYVSDGTANSAVFNVQITVTPVNDAPQITGQVALSVGEDTAITLALGDLTVSDPDSPGYPTGFTLTVQAGTGYTFSGNSVLPASNFNGVLSVNVVVNDGVSNSNSFPVQITVTPVNDAPQITGQNAVSTPEDTQRTIELADLIVSDPDNAYPTGFTLLPPGTGANYSLSGNTVIPAPDFSGILTIAVQVSDGALSSNVFPLAMQVTAVNDPPVIQGQTVISIDEDTPVTIQLSNLTVFDIDNAYPTGFSLAVLPGTSYTASGNTITPSLDFTGTLNVNITINDGTNTVPFVFQIQVGNTNDAPLITGQSVLNTDEEKPVTIELSHLSVTDPDNTYPSGFSLEVLPGVNYTVSGRTVTPAVNFAGVLTIPLRVNDGINNSGTFNFQLQVNQINDPPAFAPIADQEISENSPARSITITGITKGPLENTQMLTFVATSSNTSIIGNPIIQYDGNASTALLSYAVKPNTSGIVTITIVAIDNGSNVAPNQNSYSSSFQVSVLEINTAPTIDAINNITLLEDAEQQNITLTGIGPGIGETQTLTVTVSSTKPEFFDLLSVVYTSPLTTGLLQIKPRANVFGSAQISVTVTDNGSGISPHVNTVTKPFTVVIQPVNDAPVFTSTPVTVAVINELYQYDIIVSDPDNENLTVSAVNKPAWATLTPVSNGKARLSGRPAPADLGNVAVALEARDAISTVSQSFSVYVNVRPTVRALNISTDEDSRVTFQTSFFTSGYADLNNNAMTAIQIASLPMSGKLLLAGVEVKAGDTITAAAISGLVYAPAENYFGADVFQWKASDGYHLSLSSQLVNISVISINDPPVVILDNDTLRYEVNGEAAFLASLIDIADPDDDSLSQAQIGFARNYRLEIDRLSSQNTSNIRGEFNYQSGILTLAGKAPVSEYVQALRSVRYIHLNTFDPILEPKPVFFILNDGEAEGSPQDKLIILQYTFIEFEIPSGFTPNGDQANDTWRIDRPGGLEDLDDAVISVYNKQGVLVFRTKGFDKPWDGTLNGEVLPADTYYFTIDLQLRNKKTYKGIVTILR